MCPQELRRRLHAVDPNLNIVPGGHHYGSRQAEDNWAKAAGVICSNCGREVFRSRDGLCMPCWEQAHEIEVRDGTGITNWLPMSIIQQITHQARKER
ncbi:MAG: hypothetical protein PHQ43_01535 [Dehalococcoidales bacterium]|nr:hypothetical protein [Dehalococcoidales bacterium]